MKKQPEEHIDYTNRFYLFASLFGSFFFQAIVWTIVQAQLLSDENSKNSVSDLYWVWLIRPLPATFVLFMAYICPTLFLENALEMQCVEGLVGMLTIDIFNDVRKATNRVGDLSVRKLDYKYSQTALDHITDGANLGFAFWILSLFAVMGVLVLLVIGMARKTPLDSTPLQVWTGWSIIFNAIRMAAGFLIWAGIAGLDETVFCPNLAATGSLATIAFASTLLDHGWRALFSVDGPRFKSLRAIVR